ncbi:helix-turn-helix domain-containing protein [Cryobacterium tepidiphilum]|uniref:Transcriptional regulator n=1 Tax=Cryobacterium tepidiphilum TaxID=2486026 RepID=A0A3M8LDW3_9MICO|nr:helix-turn-helix transcriptional regulator [Cryobacterium tepidiphilum]RNE63630.1 transcriptional regulator [Cryobacterium tepidiphilum]
MPIVINLDVELAKKKMSVADFAAAIDITPVNVSVLKNGRAKAVRFSTLDAICRVLECQPGDILSWVPGDPGPDAPELHNPAQSSDPAEAS